MGSAPAFHTTGVDTWMYLVLYLDTEYKGANWIWDGKYLLNSIQIQIHLFKKGEPGNG